MTDIVERLRSVRVCEDFDLLEEAAAEIEQLRAANIGLATESHELQQEVERLRADAERLRFLAADPFCDEYGGIDLHEQAYIYASALGREDPNEDDYLAAVRDAIDAARTALAPGAAHE